MFCGPMVWRRCFLHAEWLRFAQKLGVPTAMDRDDLE